ncbi:MAG: UvrB/UvrC motif-containing protein, partial [Clostridia bacterium]|nr:UvrB/UvrC motif-containing protein [Clostridia bacterium]
PLNFSEFESKLGQVVMVSATPAEYEADVSEQVVEQIIRPTGLVDPEVEIRPIETQVDDLLGEIKERTARGERVLVTTLTKKMAEDITEYFDEQGVRVKYIHHNIETMERTELLRDLRMGMFDVLVGINLLREGIDLPEVTLVAILDADKEGLFRSTRSLIQMIGRAARNANGKVILYVDTVTKSIRDALEETDRRREIQLSYNELHGITPKTVEKRIADLIRIGAEDGKGKRGKGRGRPAPTKAEGGKISVAEEIERLTAEMKQAASELRFEEAAYLRDKIRSLSK